MGYLDPPCIYDPIVGVDPITCIWILFGFAYNKKKPPDLRRPISFFIVPHAAIVDNMRTVTANIVFFDYT